MNAVAIGPLVFSNERLQAIIAIFVFLGIVELLALRWPDRAGAARRWASIALLSWIVAARSGFVIAEWPSFAAAPLDILKLWQGGFDPRAGLFGFGLAMFAALLRRPEAVRPVLVATVCAGIALSAARFTLPEEARGRLPAITLRDLGDRPFSLRDLEGRPAVVNLWATWCPPCRREMPMMMEMAEARDDVEMRFVNQQESPAAIASYLAMEQLSSRGVLLDTDGELMAGFGVLGLPSTLFFDAEGRLAAVHTGEISRAELNARVEDLIRRSR